MNRNETNETDGIEISGMTFSECECRSREILDMLNERKWDELEKACTKCLTFMTGGKRENRPGYWKRAIRHLRMDDGNALFTDQLIRRRVREG